MTGIPDSNFNISKLELNSLNYTSIHTLQDLEADTSDNLFMAGNPACTSQMLEEFLGEEDLDLVTLALFNPSLPIESASKYVKRNYEKICEARYRYLSTLSREELGQELNLEESEAQEFLLHLIGDPSVEEWSHEFFSEAGQAFLDSYLLFDRGTTQQKLILEESQPEIVSFLSNLHKQNLLDSYALFRVDSENFVFNSHEIALEHDSRILLLEDSLEDHGAVQPLNYPDSFKPLENLDEKFIINIESGLFSVTNQIINPEQSHELKVEDIGFEVSAGYGDGYYPTIPFFDQLGELEMIVTFFTEMEYSETLEENLGTSNFFEEYLPVKKGYIECSGSLFFSDSSWISNGPSLSEQIVEVSDLPKESFLVVSFINEVGKDSILDERTMAVAVMRNRTKRKYELLFDVFPELDLKIRSETLKKLLAEEFGGRIDGTSIL